MSPIWSRQRLTLVEEGAGGAAERHDGDVTARPSGAVTA